MELIYRDINEAVVGTLDHLQTFGKDVPSRNGQSRELLYHDFAIQYPQARNIYLDGRTNNFFATVAETIWIMAGSNKLDPVISFFLPRARDYSDDGYTWTNGYGRKLFLGGQFDSVIREFRAAKDTRRAVMSVWNPYDDTLHSLQSKGIENPKDMSCTTSITFIIREDALEMKVHMRSNDVLFGMSHINIFEYTFLQEALVSILRADYPTLKMGKYRHSVQSLHAYDTVGEQCIKIRNSELNRGRDFDPSDYRPLLMPPADNLGGTNVTYNFNRFFRNILREYEVAINTMTPDNWTQNLLDRVESIRANFDVFECPTEGNVMWDYAMVPLLWISKSRCAGDRHDPMRPLVAHMSESVRQAVCWSKSGALMHLARP